MKTKFKRVCKTFGKGKGGRRVCRKYRIMKRSRSRSRGSRSKSPYYSPKYRVRTVKSHIKGTRADMDNDISDTYRGHVKWKYRSSGDNPKKKKSRYGKSFGKFNRLNRLASKRNRSRKARTNPGVLGMSFGTIAIVLGGGYLAYQFYVKPKIKEAALRGERIGQQKTGAIVDNPTGPSVPGYPYAPGEFVGPPAPPIMH